MMSPTKDITLTVRVPRSWVGRVTASYVREALRRYLAHPVNLQQYEGPLGLTGVVAVPRKRSSADRSGWRSRGHGPPHSRRRVAFGRQLAPVGPRAGSRARERYRYRLGRADWSGRQRMRDCHAARSSRVWLPANASYRSGNLPGGKTPMKNSHSTPTSACWRPSSDFQQLGYDRRSRFAPSERFPKKICHAREREQSESKI
jgi:hypothetical protein